MSPCDTLGASHRLHVNRISQEKPFAITFGDSRRGVASVVTHERPGYRLRHLCVYFYPTRRTSMKIERMKLVTAAVLALVVTMGLAALGATPAAHAACKP